MSRPQISAIVASFGDKSWQEKARTRALPSTEGQLLREVIEIHLDEGGIAEARNLGASRAKGKWLLFLDADDELAPGYAEAMQRAIEQRAGREALLTPAVQYITTTGRRESAPFFWPEIEMKIGNWMVIGTVLPRRLFLSVGGFDSRWPIYEDYCLWARCLDTGCEAVRVADAVYLAHRNGNRGRNSSANRWERTYWHQRIAQAIWPESFAQTSAEEDERRMLLTNGKPSGVLRRID